MALSRSAVDNAPLLREIGSSGSNIAALHAATGRRPDNLKVTAERLASDGLLTLAGQDVALTEDGRRALTALDVADGMISVSAEPLTALHNELRPHPDNPRKSFKEADLATLADAIAGPERVERPLIVGKPDANGVRKIYDGERRWRAVARLKADGRWPADRPLAIEEREDTPDLIFELSLVVNQTGEKLNKVEEARALYALHRAHGWEAPRLAQRTGVDKRSVQHALQVMREASPELIKAYEATVDLPAGDAKKITWEKLRESVQVQKPKPVLEVTPKLALALVELAHAIRMRPAGRPGCTRIERPQPGGAWHTLRDRSLVDSVFPGDGRMYASLKGDDVPKWLAEIDFDANPTAALFKAQADVVGGLEANVLAGDGRYVSEWLNLTAEPEPSERSPADDIVHEAQLGVEPVRPASSPPAAEAAPDAVSLYAELAVKTLEGATPPAPVWPDLNAAETLAMNDLAHALLVSGREDARGVRTVAVYSHFTDSNAQGLVFKKLVGVLQGTRNTWLMHMLPAGRAWIAARGDVSSDKEGVLYGTPWLNPPPPEPAAAPADAEPECADTPEAEPAPTQIRTPASEPIGAALPIDAYTQEALMILAEVKGSSATTPTVLSSLLTAVRLEAPFTVDRDAAGMTLFDATGRDVLTVDVNGDLPDALATARAELFARALNTAFGVAGGVQP